MSGRDLVRVLVVFAVCAAAGIVALVAVARLTDPGWSPGVGGEVVPVRVPCGGPAEDDGCVVVPLWAVDADV